MTRVTQVDVRRVFPQTPSASPHPIVSRLSILDATVARFAPAAATWFYDRPENDSYQSHEFAGILRRTLSRTLDDYPHLAGQIQWATEDMVKDTAVPRHLGRPVVVHGTPSDPGIEVIVSAYDGALADVVPDRSSSSTSPKVWDATDFRQHDFLPSTKITLSSLDALDGLPGVAVQISTFTCGGFSIGITMAHPLADALCLTTFMRSWASHTRTSLGGPPDTTPRPVFDPSLLERAAGLAPGSPQDPVKIALARSLPMHRFDWWASDAPGYPSATRPATESTMPPPSLRSDLSLSPSTFPPWPTWDMSLPVRHVHIRFQPAELSRLRASSGPVSRLDALLAHIWILINRARNLPPDTTTYLNLTLGLRARLDPPLPSTFIGSPVLLCHVAAEAGHTASSPPGPVAASIRQTVSLFTPQAVGAYIHDAAHEVSPQRLWQGFLGERHALVTSWVRAGAYEVDFLGAGRPRYVQALMPRMDGLVQVIDLPTGAFDVSLCLERGAMGRLLDDPGLHAYQEGDG